MNSIRLVPDEILTVLEVAADLRCSKAHIYNVINGTVAGVTALPGFPGSAHFPNGLRPSNPGIDLGYGRDCKPQLI